jgi:hypothetical protein
MINLSYKNLFNIKKEFFYAIKKPKKIIFDHIPKCGGSSLTAYLRKYYPTRKIFTISGFSPGLSIDHFKQLSLAERYQYDLIAGHNANLLFDYFDPESLKITILRSPVDRIISHYFFAKRTPHHYLYTTIHQNNISLEDYVKSNNLELYNLYTTHFSGLTLKNVQSNPEQAIEHALKNLMNRYDIIGFLDDFNLFIKKVCYQAQLKYHYPKKKLNVTYNRPYRDAIPTGLIQLIENANSFDIILYNKLKEMITTIP